MPNLLKLISFFPLGFQYQLADFFSLFVSIIPNRTARLVRQNIQLCLPYLGRHEQKKLNRTTIRQTLYSTFELTAIWCWPVDKVLNLVNHENLCDAFQQSQKGRIVLVPHLGSWEILNLWLAREGNYMALYKPQINSRFDHFIFTARGRNGAEMLPIVASGLRRLSRGLKQGKTVMILPDQRPKKDKTRVMSTFYGQEAPTTPLIHNLCKRIDCDVFLATAFRDRNTARFNINIELLDHSKLASEQQTSVNYMNRAIESLIDKRPEQYQWGYSRFVRSTYRQLNDN